jgi:hypothetical protein
VSEPYIFGSIEPAKTIASADPDKPGIIPEDCPYSTGRQPFIGGDLVEYELTLSLIQPNKNQKHRKKSEVKFQCNASSLIYQK